MKLSFKLSFVIFILLFVFACTKDNIINTSETNQIYEYFPISKDSWWIYNKIFKDKDNNIKSDTFFTSIQYIDTLDDEIIIGFNLVKNSTEVEYMSYSITESKLFSYIFLFYGEILIADFNTKEKIICKDSVSGYNSPSDTYYKQFLEITKEDKINYNIKNRIVSAEVFKIMLNYFDDNIISNKYTQLTDIYYFSFVKNIGIINKTHIFKFSDNNNIVFNDTNVYNLIDYEIK
ncbi:MAG: hypothetical protein HZB41_04490 [Ignavibacteriae bacterium]|nr:hypothetical protein [Ignavibacteriota bacterium]